LGVPIAVEAGGRSNQQRDKSQQSRKSSQH
jgi:hypothetical protein